jgi:hypothetical protein
MYKDSVKHWNDRSLITAVNRSESECAPLHPSRVNAEKEWVCAQSAQGKSSHLLTKQLQNTILQCSTIVSVMCTLQK